MWKVFMNGKCPPLTRHNPSTAACMHVCGYTGECVTFTATPAYTCACLQCHTHLLYLCRSPGVPACNAFTELNLIGFSSNLSFHTFTHSRTHSRTPLHAQWVLFCCVGFFLLLLFMFVLLFCLPQHLSACPAAAYLTELTLSRANDVKPTSLRMFCKYYLFVCVCVCMC